MKNPSIMNSNTIQLVKVKDDGKRSPLYKRANITLWEEKKKKKRKKSDGRETLSEIGPFRIPNFEEEDALALLLVPLILRLTSPIEEAFRGRRETREGKSI